jgi:hypothetical protein
MTFNTNFPMPFEKDNEYNALDEIDENTNEILFSFERSNPAYTTGSYLGSTSVLTKSPIHFNSLGGPDGTHWLEIQADSISASPSPSSSPSVSASASTPHNYHSVLASLSEIQPRGTLKDFNEYVPTGIPAIRALPNFLATPVLDLPDEGNETGSTKGPRPNVALSLQEVGNQ